MHASAIAWINGQQRVVFDATVTIRVKYKWGSKIVTKEIQPDDIIKWLDDDDREALDGRNTK